MKAALASSVVTAFLMGSSAAVPAPHIARVARGLPAGIGVVPRSYDVELAYIGYTGLAESVDCAALVDTLGYDSLVGRLTGFENPAEPDGNVVYSGLVRRVTRIDYCITRPNPTPDQVVLCKTTLAAAATMAVELMVYGDDGRGAWLKASPAKAPDSARVQGTCLQADMDAIKADYPKGDVSGAPDGQPIAEFGALKLALQGIRRLRPGYFPPAPPETVWGLRVVRIVP